MIGLALRLLHLAAIAQAPDFDAPQFESQYHDYWARALLTGDWTPPAGVTDPEIPHRPYFRPPGYPYFLAAVYLLTGPSYLGPRLVQILLGLASCVLVFALGRRGFGPIAGLGAAALTATAWVLIFFEGELMAPSLLIALLLAATLLAERWRDGFTPGRTALAGLLLGLAILVRPNAAVLAPAFLLWALWLRRRRGERLLGRAVLLPAAVFVLAAILTTLPATVRNLRVAGDPVWITANAGINLFVGTHPESDGYTPGVRELGELTGMTGWDSFDHPKIAAAVAARAGRPLEDSEVSAFFVRRALANLVEHPLASLRLLGRKHLLFWGPAEVSNNKVLAQERRHSLALRLGPGFATLLALALLGAGLLVWRSVPARSADAGPEPAAGVELGVLLGLLILAYALSYLPFFVAARFRAPLLPFLALFAGHALAVLWRALRDRRPRLLATGVAVFLVLRLLTGVAWIPYEDDVALWHWRRGILWQEQGDSARALAEYRRTVEADPGHWEAHLALADLLAPSDEALGHYRAALEIEPTSITAHNNLATALARRGELEAAIEHWETVLRLDPGRLSALTNLAFALASHPDPDRRDLERARALAERARALAPEDPRLRSLLETVPTGPSVGRP